MTENLSCEDCGRWFSSAGALRLHRYADHGVTEPRTTGPVDAIPAPVSPRLANQLPPFEDDPDRLRLPDPRRRLLVGAAVVLAVALALVGALWRGGYLGSDDVPEPMVLDQCVEPDFAKIEQLEQEWALISAAYNEQRNEALGANDTERVQELDTRRLEVVTTYDMAMMSLMSCVDTDWDFSQE